MNATSNQPINILSIDGSSNGFPELCMLEEMFSRLKYDLKSEEELRPCDYFDIIGGTGTGALVALLLGRMKMTTTQAIEAYIKLIPVLSVESTEDKEQRKKNNTAFEDAFRKLLKDGTFNVESPLLDENGSKTLVFALNTVSMSTLHILRSYHTRSSQPPPFTVLQAACAGVASQDKFGPVTIGEGHKQVTLVDATTGYSNPTTEILREAREAFGGEVEVATILSLGVATKAVRVDSTGVSESSEKEVLQQILENCEKVHHEVHRRLGESAIYHRFTIDIEARLPPNEVSGRVSSYLQQDSTSSAFDLAIQNIRKRVGGPTLNDINSVTPIEITLKPRPSLVRDFVGREDVLHAMRQTHFGNCSGEISVPSISILTGLGGSGKTQIALKFALEYEGRQSDAPVYFIDGSKETTLKTDLETIIRSQGPNYRSASYEDALIWFATKSRQWLMIIDNVDDPSVKLSSFIPRCLHGHIIVTTRDATRKVLAPDSTHEVEGLSATDSVTLLLKSSNYKSKPSNQIHAKAIVEELGHLPLALAHAAAYISIHQCLSTFLSTYRQSRAQVLGSKPDLIQGYPRSVAATIQMSLDQLSPRARDLLRIFAHLDARSIACAVLVKAAERRFRYVVWTEEVDLQPATVEQANILMKIFCPNHKWMPVTFDEIISTCLRYSLLRVATQNEERFFSMHVLVQSYLQENAGSVNEHIFPRLIVRLLGSAVITSQYEYDHFALYRLLFPHIRLINIEDVVEPGDRYGFGVVLSEMGDGRVAITHLERCVDKWKQQKGEEDKNTLAAMTRLGNCYGDVGWKERALGMRERVLELCRRVRGDEDLETITNMHNLANSYSDTGRDQEALKLEETVLEERKKLLGGDHRNTLDTMHNLANSYSAVGREQEALELRKTVLEKRRGLLGDEHQDTLDAMESLAASYSAMKRDQEALFIYRLVLAKRAATLGKEHVKTLQAMYNLALTYRKLEMVAELEQLLRTALPLYERVLGADHEDTQWLREDDVWVQSRAVEDRFNMEIIEEEALNSDADSTEMQSNGKRKQTAQGSRERTKRRK